MKFQLKNTCFIPYPCRIQFKFIFVYYFNSKIRGRINPQAVLFFIFLVHISPLKILKIKSAPLFLQKKVFEKPHAVPYLILLYILILDDDGKTHVVSVILYYDCIVDVVLYEAGATKYLNAKTTMVVLINICFRLGSL